MVKNPSSNAEDTGSVPGWERRAHVLWGSFLGTSSKTQHRKKRKGSKVRSNSGLDQEIRKASLEMTQV